MHVNNDLVSLLRQRLAQAERGEITDVIAVFGRVAQLGVTGQAFTVVDLNSAEQLIGGFELLKPQISAVVAQARAQSQKIMPVSGQSLPPLPPDFFKKMNGGG
jgi:hypothetical protein